VGALDLNNRGQIVGQGINPSGQWDAFLLTPISEPPEVPVPAALPLFATGIGAMGLIGW
jgi:hypothetical protein